MKTEHITYDKFLQTTTKMLENGEKLTVRAIHSRLGGSFVKISAFLKQLAEERAYLNLSKQSDISDSLRQSILNEIGKAVKDSKIALDSQISQLTSHLEEANEQLKEQEKSFSLLLEENTVLKDKLILTQQSINDLEFIRKELKDKVEYLQKEKTLAVTETAKSQLQLERANSDNKEMKEQIKIFQTLIDKITQEKYLAEKNAAVAEAKLEQVRHNNKINQ